MSTLVVPNDFSAGQVSSAAAVNANFTAVESIVNGLLSDDNVTANSLTTRVLAQAIREAAGLNASGEVRRGKSIIATEEARTNVAYGTLTTPDQVQNVVLPTDGLIAIAYQAMWKESVDDAATAGIFIGANQLQIGGGNSASPFVQEAAVQASVPNVYKLLCTGGRGLVSAEATLGATAYTGHVTTGQVVGVKDGGGAADTGDGGVCYAFAAAGTYTVSVQFKASSGSVTAKERKLWVWSIGF